MSPVASRARARRPGSEADDDAPADGAEDMPATALDLDVAVGRDAGVWSRPIADTELRRFFNAAKADDWGKSINSP